MVGEERGGLYEDPFPDERDGMRWGVWFLFEGEEGLGWGGSILLCTR